MLDCCSYQAVTASKMSLKARFLAILARRAVRLPRGSGASNSVNRSVHDQVSRSGSVVGRLPYDGIFKMPNFAEFFAELCALDAPIAPIHPPYSVENMCTPSITIRLLTGCS
jgi:hypothetical protein